MTRIIMCGCNGAMGRMITGIVNEDAEAEIVAGIDMVDTKEHCYPVFQKLADCDVEADALIDFSTPKILDDIAQPDMTMSSLLKLKKQQHRQLF